MWPCRVGCWLVRSEGSSCLLLHSNDVGPSLFTEEIQITDSYAGTDGNVLTHLLLQFSIAQQWTVHIAYEGHRIEHGIVTYQGSWSP